MSATPQHRNAAEARRLFAKVRSMKRNLRLGLYQGRNGGGDFAGALARAEQLVRELPRDLQGMLWSEHRLADRLSENRDVGQPRPELQARMTRQRRDLRARLAAL